MSHISVVKSKIRSPNVELLNQVFQALAQKYNAEIVDYVEDYYGNREKALVALKIPETQVMKHLFGKTPEWCKPDIYYYIGVNIGENGELLIIGDTYGWRKLYHKIKQEITDLYVFYATVLKLQEMGYQLGNVQELEGGIYAEAVEVKEL